MVAARLMCLVLLSVLVTLTGCRSGGPYGCGWGNASEVHKAVWRGDSATIQRLGKLHWDLDSEATIPGCSSIMTDCPFRARPLDLAARKGDWKMFDELVGAGVTPSAHHLTNAIGVDPEHDQRWQQTGSSEYIRRLVANGVDPNAPDPERGPMLPLEVAVHEDKFEACRTLLDCGADARRANKFGGGPLNMDQSLEPRFVRMLLAHGADAKQINSEGNSTLHKMWRQEHVESVRMLLEAGADPNHLNNQGVSPLELNPGGSVGYALVVFGAKTVNLSNSGQTAIHLIAREPWRGDVKQLVPFYVSRGAPINGQDSLGKTALHLAIESSSPDLGAVQALIDAGASPTIADKAGKTPLDLSRERIKREEAEMAAANPAASRQGSPNGLANYESSLRRDRSIVAMLEQHVRR